MKRVETTFTFREYNYLYLFGIDGEKLQPYKTFSGIIESHEHLSEEDEADLYMLSLGERIKQKNPHYDPEEESDVEYFKVSYLPKTIKNEDGEEEEIHYVIEKNVNYDKFEDTDHTNKTPVESAKQAMGFIHNTASKYTKHNKEVRKTSEQDDPTLRYWLTLTLDEEELEKMKEDGSDMSTSLQAVDFKFFYK